MAKGESQLRHFAGRMNLYLQLFQHLFYGHCKVIDMIFTKVIDDLGVNVKVMMTDYVAHALDLFPFRIRNL